MALSNHRLKSGVLHHSGRGSRYASIACKRKLQEAGLPYSMNRRGECYDYTVIESFFGTSSVSWGAHTRGSNRSSA